MPRFLGYVWWFFMHKAEEKNRLKFRSRLWVPPPSKRNEPIPVESPWSAENEQRAFAAFSAQVKA